MQVLFENSTEHSGDGLFTGLNEWPGTIEKLTAPVLPHMGWNTVTAAAGSQLFSGVENERFYFVHSFAARNWELDPHEMLAAPKVSWSNHGEDFVAAVENGPLWATQFHPEKSGEAGLTLLKNWIAGIK
jgi:glutamine amidotransferase